MFVNEPVYIRDGVDSLWAGWADYAVNVNGFGDLTMLGSVERGEAIVAGSKIAARQIVVSGCGTIAVMHDDDLKIGDRSIPMRCDQIAAGRSHIVALSNGTIHTWGDTHHGEDQPMDNVDIIACGGNMTAAISNKRLYLWGWSDQVNMTEELDGVDDVVAGDRFVAVLQSGRVRVSGKLGSRIYNWDVVCKGVSKMYAGYATLYLLSHPEVMF